MTKSSLASEALILDKAADAGFLISSLVQGSVVCLHCYTDNVSLYETLWSTKVISDKRLRVDVARLRKIISRNEIRVSWIERERKQLADLLTKRSASTKKLLEVLHFCQI